MYISNKSTSYHIYNLAKLKQEHFTKFICDSYYINMINKINLNTTYYSQNYINLLFNFFTELTEKENGEFYVNHEVFN